MQPCFDYKIGAVEHVCDLDIEFFEYVLRPDVPVPAIDEFISNSLQEAQYWFETVFS